MSFGFQNYIIFVTSKIEDYRVDMFIVIGLMFSGVLLGYLFRTRNLSKIHRLITVLIWLLLFILGIEVGGNERIVKGLHNIGLESVILTVGGTLGSVITAWGLWKILYKKDNEQA